MMKELLERAIAAHQSGHLEEAKKLYSEVIQRNPNFAYAHYLLGVLLMAGKEPSSSLVLLKKAVSLESDKSPYFCALGQAQRLCYDYASALESFAKAVALNPNYYEAILYQGYVLTELGDFIKAESLLKQASDLMPNTVLSRLMFGHWYLKVGKTDMALMAYQTVLTMQPDLFEGLSGMGIVYRERGELEQAHHFLRKAFDINNERPEAHFELGKLFLLQGKEEWAISAFESALKKDPHFLDAYVELATFRGREEKYAESFVYAEKAFKIAGRLAKVQRLFIRHALLSGNQHRALAASNAFLEMNPTDVSVLKERALALYFMGEKAEAKCRYSAALVASMVAAT